MGRKSTKQKVKENNKEFMADVQNSAQWILQQEARQGKTDIPIEFNGKHLKNYEVLLLSMLQNGNDGDNKSAMSLLQIAGINGAKMIDNTPENIAQQEKQKKESAKQFKKAKAEIIKLLKDSNCYEDKNIYNIELAARELVIYRQLSEQVLSGKVPMIETELSREGSPRKKTSPVFMELQQQAKNLRDSLRDLTMSPRHTKSNVGEKDGLAEFLDKLNDEDD